MGRRRLVLAGLAVAIVGGLMFFGLGGGNRRPRYAVALADRGDIADVVGATGVLQAVTTVQVGSQVSGTIASLNADFNSIVKRGQVVARLDPALFEARLAQARANLASARANVERSRAAIDDARQKYERAKALAAQDLVPEADLESAKAAYDGAVAQQRANEAAVSQAEAAVNQAQLDLEHTVISAPIDGVVLGRNVDVGQTVAASLQAPTLFVIANDLTRMQVKASIDEADIGRIRSEQPVTFRVDAFPDEVFAGRVAQVRLQPITNQNVVTYDTLISVDNPGQRLMPGMTATVSVVVERKTRVLRVPAAALRFRPEGFESRVPARASQGTPSATGTSASSGGRTPSGSQAHDRPGSGTRSSQGPGRPGLVFVVGDDGRPLPQAIHLGLSDGTFTEVLDGLQESAKVISGFEQEKAATGRAAASPSNNPFSPQRPQPRTR
jgi:HlyD family secretion protein